MRRTSFALLATLCTLTACEVNQPTGASESLQPTQLRAVGSDSWSPALSIEVATPGAHPNFNTAFLDGCPLPSRDGKRFFIASTRPGSQGIDIWMSSRSHLDQPWGEPVNVGAPVNSEFNDFCPMLARDGRTFYFVSNRPGGCGGTDIYVSRLGADGLFAAPENLGCDVNSAWDEAGPVPVFEPGEGLSLYFSSVRPGGFAPDAPGATLGDSDLYVSRAKRGRFQSASLVPGVNSAQDDGQPFIRQDALELFFFSNRPGTLGGNDIWVATRASTRKDWRTPVNLGPAVNTDAAETRPSLSLDGSTLYFGSTRSTGEGGSDVYVTRRQKPRNGGR